MKKKIYKRITLATVFTLGMIALSSCGDKEKEITYTITFNSNDPDTSDTIAPTLYNDTTIVKGASLNYASYTPTYEGYRFAGWYTDSDLTNEYKSGDAINDNITLYAKWQKVVVVTFDTDGGSSVSSITTDANTTISKPTDPTKDAIDNGDNTVYKYTFEGWYNEDGTAYDFSSAVNSDITLKAKYTKTLAPKDGYSIISSTIDFNTYEINTKAELQSSKTPDGVFEISADGDKNEIEGRNKTWTKGETKEITLSETQICTGVSSVKIDEYNTLDNLTEKKFTKGYIIAGKKSVTGTDGTNTYTSLSSLNVTCDAAGYIAIYAEVNNGIGILNVADSTYTEIDTVNSSGVAQYVFHVEAGTYKIYRTTGSGRIFQAEYYAIKAN